MGNHLIRGINGIELGQEFYSESPRLSEMDSGESVYAVDMEGVLFGMTNCHVCVTPVSYQVSMIFLHRDVFECDVVEKLLKDLKHHISGYGHVEEIPQECGMLTNYRCGVDKREVLMKSKKLVGQRVRITLCYLDHDIKDMAEDEREETVGMV